MRTTVRLSRTDTQTFLSVLDDAIRYLRQLDRHRSAAYIETIAEIKKLPEPGLIPADYFDDIDRLLSHLKTNLPGESASGADAIDEAVRFAVEHCRP